MIASDFYTCPTVHPKTPPTRNRLYAWYVDEINRRLSAKIWADAVYKKATRQSFFSKFYNDEPGACTALQGSEQSSYAGIKILGE